MDEESNAVLDSISFRLIKFAYEYYLKVQKICKPSTDVDREIEYYVKEPVIRLIGRSTDVMDVCIHVHNYYPYFFVCIDSFFEKVVLVDWMLEFENGIEKFLRELEKKNRRGEKNGKISHYKHIQSIQLVRGKSIYGYHDSDQLFLRINLYDPNHVVPLARVIPNGKLPRPSVSIPETEKDYFPPILAYEHKYNYKLKFFTDHNIRMLTMMTVNNIVLRPQIHSSYHDSLLANQIDWCRHTLCSIEGDVLISNVVIENSHSGEYLIPSLLMLKRKVEKVFGSQEVESLSENRPNTSELTCSDEVGQEQFKLFAENVLRNNELLTKESMTLPTTACQEVHVSDVESQSDSFEAIVNDDNLFDLLSETEKKDVDLTQFQPNEKERDHQESEIHSSLLLSFISQYEKCTEQPPVPSLISEGDRINQYVYQVQPPSRSFSLLTKRMKDSHLDVYYYNTVGDKKEFDTMRYLASLPSYEDIQVDPNRNRIMFWKELLKEQQEMDEQLVFNSYIYQYQPPQIPIQSKQTQLSFTEDSSTFEGSSLSSSASQITSSLPSLRLFSFELLCRTNDEKKPHPKTDPIIAVFYSYSESDRHNNDNTPIKQGLILDTTAITTVLPPYIQHLFHSYHDVTSEHDLIVSLVNCVISFNPDILVAYETQRDSIGYFIDRCEYLEIPATLLLSRCPFTFLSRDIAFTSTLERYYYVDTSNEYRYNGQGNFSFIQNYTEGEINVNKSNTAYNQMKGNTISMYGRYVVAVSRVLRRSGYHNKNNFDYCAIIQNLYQKVVPRLSNHVLYTLMNHPSTMKVAIQYLQTKNYYCLHILFHTHILNQIIESCSIQGIDIEDEFTRGSQYKIENILLRINNTPTYSYICLNATETQLSYQPPTVSIPLVMEPYSRLYSSPVIILDFQSLYPSVMIAYNICFSTCLGNINRKTGIGLYKGTGFDREYEPSLSAIRTAYEGGFHVSPTGTVFVNRSVRTGIIVRMVEEILRIRVMIKKVLKRNKNHPYYDYYESILNFNQQALKMIVNTTYGYINAGFSGRMPNSQLGDSIVEYARVVLNHSLQYVEHHYPELEIVYADTDSMFLHCQGMSRKEAFALGRKLEEEISAQFPSPITLKFEKLYHPCVLVTKKRYTGFCYMSEDENPFVEGKGIEMIRGDQCEYIQQISRELLTKVFSFCSESEIQEYIQGEFQKLLSNQIPISQLILWKEVKLGNYKSKKDNVTDARISERFENEEGNYYNELLASNSSLPPAAVVSIQSILEDERETPLYKEKVPYVVVYGEPGGRLKDCVISPYKLYSDEYSRINTTYYIHKQVIPVINRLTQIFQIDISKYYDSMKTISIPPHYYIPSNSRQIDSLWPRKCSHFPFDVKCHHSFSHCLEEESESDQRKKGIDTFYNSNMCFFCKRTGTGSDVICDRCKQNPIKLLACIGMLIRKVEDDLNKCQLHCMQCLNCPDIEDVVCTNISCDYSFSLHSLIKEYKYYLYIQDRVYHTIA